jgi:hypothetical protein
MIDSLNGSCHVQADQCSMIVRKHSFEREIQFDGRGKAVILTIGTTWLWSRPVCSDREFLRVLSGEAIKGTFGHIPKFKCIDAKFELDIFKKVVAWRLVHEEIGVIPES